jgi:hypothetical protein
MSEIAFSVQRYGGEPCTLDAEALAKMARKPWECSFGRMLSELRKDEMFSDLSNNGLVFLTEVNDVALDAHIPITKAKTALSAGEAALLSLGSSEKVRSLCVLVRPSHAAPAPGEFSPMHVFRGRSLGFHPAFRSAAGSALVAMGGASGGTASFEAELETNDVLLLSNGEYSAGMRRCWRRRFFCGSLFQQSLSRLSFRRFSQILRAPPRGHDESRQHTFAAFL